MIRNFRKLKGSREIGVDGIICLYDNLMKLDENNFIPISSVIHAKKNHNI